jgi:oxygen-dependent protoporphyrinogen oxidase
MRALAGKQPPRPLFSSLKDGMQQMVDAIVGRLDPSALRIRTRVRAVYPQGDRWRLAIDMGGNEMFDAVIVATPANVGGALLEGVDRDLADDLLGVTYSSSVTVTLGYHIEQLRHLPPGFGFLVPRSEGRRMLACTFVHHKFPHRAPADKGILRCFLGGARDEAVLNLTDDEIVDRVRKELHAIVKLEARPMFDRIYRWRGAMAQYELGHLARIARIEKRLKDIPGLEVAGNAYHGIGVPDCIREGMNAANRVVQTLSAPAAQQTRSPVT